MKSTTERYISASKKVITQLAKASRCTEKFVYMALTYRADTEKARKIRHAAVKEYGAIPMRHCPECETLFVTEVDGEQYMRQMFNNGAVIMWRKGTSEVTVRHCDNEEVFQCKSLIQFSEVQLYAESL